jgi:hypothetical protein
MTAFFRRARTPLLAVGAAGAIVGAIVVSMTVLPTTLVVALARAARMFRRKAVPTNNKSIFRVLVGVICFATIVIVPQFVLAADSDSAAITVQKAHDIAVEAYTYFYPLVLMDLTRRMATNIEPGKIPGFGPMNAFSHMREFPSADFRTVVRPNFDTLYSSAWLDLTAEPMIVSVPDTHGRYYLLPMLDMWTNVFAVPGKRTSGTTEAHFAVVAPGWTGDLPQGVEKIQAPTPYVWIIGRTQTNGPADYDEVHTIQDGYTVTPLSQWGNPPVPPKVNIDPTVDMKTPPLRQVNVMPADQFFTYAAELMKVNPPHATDWSQIARFKKIGIEPGKSFVFSSLDQPIQDALKSGAADAQQNMYFKIPTIAREVNGWQMNTDTMGVYGNYYLKRAIVAMTGLGANQCEDAIYPFNIADAAGNPLVGEKNYVFHFNKDELPPVGAFWSVTMYDEEGFQVANPINRYAISSWMDLKYNADGSLDIYLQHNSPGPDKESNWLPSPEKGVLGVTMRLYAPKPQALDGRWAPPPIRATQPGAELSNGSGIPQ